MDASDDLTADLPLGLDTAAVEAARRLHGRNVVDPARRGGLATTLRSVLSEPMFVLLLLAAGVYLSMGDPGEGVLLGFFAGVTVGLVVFQERRSERAIEALRALAAPQARAWRAGVLVRLPAAELVPGDLVLLDEGERVPADGVVREGASLAVDESLLTGESVPVRKQAVAAARPAREGAPGVDEACAVFAGTLVVRGHARMEVTATGGAMRVGRIGASLAAIEAAPTPMAAQLRRVVRVFAAGAVVTSLGLAAWYGLVQHAWLQGLLAAIALAMAMLPEEFPMALSIFLALGAWRLARARVLVRRPFAIDSLGATTLLCVDKTGTLTENRMRLARAEAVDDTRGARDDLLDAARDASRADTPDPIDRAVIAAAAPWRIGAMPVRAYPLAPGHPMMGQAWRVNGGFEVAVKGAPEAVLALCGEPTADIARWRDRAAALAADGLRVIAVARTGGLPALPDRLADLDLAAIGLLGFADPLRAGTREAVAAARAAGVGVAMITGDHAATALAVARQAGIDVVGGVLQGADLAALDDAGLGRAVQRTRVFARVTPEQKLRLVRAFQAAGHVVAMTGDGVNDAPALKAAHVGIAMGARGTDVAREAAEVVLLDEDVGHVVEGIALGRRIFDNLRHVMLYIVAIHVPIAGAALLPLLAGWPPLLLPVHVVLTEMVIDPMCSLAFENAPARAGLMTEPPRRAGAALVDRGVFVRGLVQGGAMLGLVLATDRLALTAGLEPSAARALAVTALTAGNVALVAVDAGVGLGLRGMARREFASFWLVALVAAIAVALGLWLPPAQRLLHFAAPPASGLALVLAAVVGLAGLLAVFASPRATRAMPDANVAPGAP